MKTYLYVLSNDAKWMEKEVGLPFVPYPGFDLVGFTGEQPLRISGMSYDVPQDILKIRLAWLSAEPMNSGEMEGWNVK